jgi:hypothetical protein
MVDVSELRPHPLAGRVSTDAIVGLKEQKVTVGSILDVVGRALHAGVTWATIEFMLHELRLPAEKRRANIRMAQPAANATQ